MPDATDPPSASTGLACGSNEYDSENDLATISTRVSAKGHENAQVSAKGLPIIIETSEAAPASEEDALTVPPGKVEFSNAFIVCVGDHVDPTRALIVYEEKMLIEENGFGKVGANDDMVVVRVEASTVSRTDCELRRGLFTHRSLPYPHAVGCDAVGVVVRVPASNESNTSILKIGDRVCAVGLGLGGNSRYLSLPISSVIPVPDGVDPTLAACLLQPYAMAYQCLHRTGRPLREKEVVLVVGGDDVANSAIVQLAVSVGASVVYTTGAKSATTEVKMGATSSTEVVNLTSRDPEEWLPVVEGKIDLAVDLTSMPGGKYEFSQKALKQDGTGLLVVAGSMCSFPLLSDTKASCGAPLLLASLRTRLAELHTSTLDRTVVYDLFEECKPGGVRRRKYERDLRTLFSMLLKGSIAPRVRRCVTLGEVALEHTRIEAGGCGDGQVVCLPFSTEAFRKYTERLPQADKSEIESSVPSAAESEAREDVDILSGTTALRANKAKKATTNDTRDMSVAGSEATTDTCEKIVAENVPKKLHKSKGRNTGEKAKVAELKKKENGHAKRSGTGRAGMEIITGLKTERPLKMAATTKKAKKKLMVPSLKWWKPKSKNPSKTYTVEEASSDDSSTQTIEPKPNEPPKVEDKEKIVQVETIRDAKEEESKVFSSDKQKIAPGPYVKTSVGEMDTLIPQCCSDEKISAMANVTKGMASKTVEGFWAFIDETMETPAGCVPSAQSKADLSEKGFEGKVKNSSSLNTNESPEGSTEDKSGREKSRNRRDLPAAVHVEKASTASFHGPAGSSHDDPTVSASESNKEESASGSGVKQSVDEVHPLEGFQSLRERMGTVWKQANMCTVSIESKITDHRCVQFDDLASFNIDMSAFGEYNNTCNGEVKKSSSQSNGTNSLAVDAEIDQSIKNAANVPGQKEEPRLSTTAPKTMKQGEGAPTLCPLALAGIPEGLLHQKTSSELQNVDTKPKLSLSESLANQMRHPPNKVAFSSSTDMPREIIDVYQNETVSYEKIGGPNVLFVEKINDYFTYLSPDDVIVKVEASTVSRLDCEIRREVFSRHSITTLPRSTGCDLVGRVVKVGEGMDPGFVKVGDRVCAVGLTLGGNARYVCVKYDSLLPLAPDVDAVHAACIIRTYVMAYQCLHRAGGRKVGLKGEKVLIIGGCGCVGQAIAQLAKAAGATEIFVTGGERVSKREMESRGYIKVGYDPWQWMPVVEGEMDKVIDLVYSHGYDASLRALSPDGVLVCAGSTTQDGGRVAGFINSLTSMNQAYRFMYQVHGYDFFREFVQNPSTYRRDLDRLLHMLKKGDILPNVQSCIPLHAVPSAHRNIEGGALNGAIVCLPFGPKEINYNQGPKTYYRVPKQIVLSQQSK